MNRLIGFVNRVTSLL